METWLTRTLEVDVPLILAPMAGVSEGVLAGAVSSAGGLGMIGIGPARTRAYVEEQAVVAASSSSPYGIGLLAWALEQDPEPLQAAIESHSSWAVPSSGPLLSPSRPGGPDCRACPRSCWESSSLWTWERPDTAARSSRTPCCSSR